MLAVTYITAAGDTIGDYNPEIIYNRDPNRDPESRRVRGKRGSSP